MANGEENIPRTSPSFMHAISKMTFVASAVLVSTVALRAADWPQWRGANRDGHARGAAAISTLPKELKPVWKLPVGPGFSAPVVANGKLVYLDEQNGKEVAHCLEAATGKPLWNTPFAASAGDEWGSGPRCTPFIDGDRVYVQSMNGEFHCLSLADGKSQWNLSFEKYGISFSTKSAEGTASRRGNNGSGVIEGDRVYVPVGARGASIVCLDKRSGREIWKTGDDEAAYSSFVVATLAGAKQLVAFTADALTGLDLQSGETLWRVPFRTGAKRHAATPVVIGDTVTVNSQTIGLVCTRVSKDGGKWTTTQAWVNKPLTINLATPVLVDGHLYVYGPIRTKDYVCVNATSGETKWTQGGFGLGKDQTDYASSIAVGKNVLILTYDGQLVLIAADPAKYTELARAQVCGKTWSHPALVDGKLYVRDGRELQCLDLTARQVAAH
jgi:outer membrane protein assembly factor BamB